MTSAQASQDSISSQCYGMGAGAHAESKGTNDTATEAGRATVQTESKRGNQKHWERKEGYEHQMGNTRGWKEEKAI